MRVNKRELANLLGVSLPTLDAWLIKHGDRFPVIQRGTNGLPWVFDVPAVRAFLELLEAEEAAEAAARKAALAQLALPVESAADAALADLKPSERLAHVRALAAEDDLAIKRGFLVFTSDVRKALQASIARWGRMEFSAVRQAAARMNVPEPIVRELEADLRGARETFLRDLAEFLRDAPEAGSLFGGA